MRQRPFLLAVLGTLVMAGCGHKPLKAPCARDEGPAMTYAAFHPGGNAGMKRACGPMRSVRTGAPLTPGRPVR